QVMRLDMGSNQSRAALSSSKRSSVLAMGGSQSRIGAEPSQSSAFSLRTRLLPAHFSDSLLGLSFQSPRGSGRASRTLSLLFAACALALVLTASAYAATPAPGW